MDVHKISKKKCCNKKNCSNNKKKYCDIEKCYNKKRPDYDYEYEYEYHGHIKKGKEFKKAYPNKKFYKLTNKSEYHNSYQYKTGLNSDINKFSRHECRKGGLYFTDKENIMRWLFYRGDTMVWVREVTICDDSLVATGNGKYWTDNFILSERESFWDSEHWQKYCISQFIKSGFNFGITQIKNTFKYLLCHDCTILKRIENQPVQLCIYSIKIIPHALKCIRDQTDELCKYAIDRDIDAMLYIRNQTDELCKYAIDYNLIHLKNIRNQTDELCKYAISSHISALQYVRNQTDELCKYAIDCDWHALHHIKVQTDELCKYALSRSWHAIELISSPTTELNKYAFSQMNLIDKIAKMITDKFLL